MSFRALCQQIRNDLGAHQGDWTRPGFRAIAVYRFGVWRMGVRPRWLRGPLSALYKWGFRHCRNVYGIELPYTCTIGQGVIIEHQGGIVIHGATVIGDRCIIRQNCTLGIRRLGSLDDAPILCANVQVGAGAVILGKVTVGQGAAIGANAVVLTDVPAGALAIGVPATIRQRP